MNRNARRADVWCGVERMQSQRTQEHTWSRAKLWLKMHSRDSSVAYAAQSLGRQDFVHLGMAGLPSAPVAFLRAVHHGMIRWKSRLRRGACCRKEVEWLSFKVYGGGYAMVLKSESPLDAIGSLLMLQTGVPLEEYFSQVTSTPNHLRDGCVPTSWLPCRLRLLASLSSSPALLPCLARSFPRCPMSCPPIALSAVLLPRSVNVINVASCSVSRTAHRANLDNDRLLLLLLLFAPGLLPPLCLFSISPFLNPALANLHSNLLVSLGLDQTAQFTLRPCPLTMRVRSISYSSFRLIPR